METAIRPSGRAANTRFVWNRAAGVGTAIWIGAVAGILACGHADPNISPLMLLAPVALVPLALDVRAVREWYGSSRAAAVARRYQIPACVALAIAFVLPAGVFVATLAIPWLVVGALWAIAAVSRFGASDGWTDSSVCLLAAALSLPIGGGWIILSRGGIAPLGFAEPIVLLTGVHFHYSGFVAATLLGLAFPLIARGSRTRKLIARLVTVAGIASPPVIAAGFVFSPALKLAAVAVFGVALAGFAALILTRRERSMPLAAETLLRVAAFSIVLSMTLAAAYELGEFSRAYAIPIPLMVLTHGLLNVFGFSVCGLLALHGAKPAAVRE